MTRILLVAAASETAAAPEAAPFGDLISVDVLLVRTPVLEPDDKLMVWLAAASLNDAAFMDGVVKLAAVVPD